MSGTDLSVPKIASVSRMSQVMFKKDSKLIYYNEWLEMCMILHAHGYSENPSNKLKYDIKNTKYG